jgi:hypothetical protein
LSMFILSVLSWWLLLSVFCRPAFCTCSMQAIRFLFSVTSNRRKWPRSWHASNLPNHRHHYHTDVFTCTEDET